MVAETTMRAPFPSGWASWPTSLLGSAGLSGTVAVLPVLDDGAGVLRAGRGQRLVLLPCQEQDKVRAFRDHRNVVAGRVDHGAAVRPFGYLVS